MSWVTSLMLHISLVEDVDALIEPINVFFRSYPHSVTGKMQSDTGLQQMSQLVPGGKMFGSNIFVGAYNYFPIDTFVEHLRSMPWAEPEHSQLFVMDEEDLSFRVIPLGV
jgi:hypothetical protein